MTKIKNVSREAALFASNAERQIAALNKALKSMSDNVSGLQRGIYAPVLKGGKRYSKTVRSGPSPFLAGGIAAAGRIFSGNILDATGLGGSASAAQVASSWLGAFQKAQRIT